MSGNLESTFTQRLRLSECSRETGHQRYRLPKKRLIPFALSRTNPALAHIQDEPNLAVVAPIDVPHVQFNDGFEDVQIWDDDPSDGDEDIAQDDDEDEQAGEGEATATSETADRVPESTPRVCEWRLNLTGLSQRYNLYFVAYKNQIHASRPRCCITNRLPAKPDVVLAPKPSLRAWQVGGHVDLRSPHQVNQLIVAQFGEEEVLLLAYDDGDVIGYYTRHVDRWVGSHADTEVNSDPRQPCRDIVPFFHENVDKSAWGLAVHESSRLIAVGTNLHEVTVFVPALAQKDRTKMERPELRTELWKTVRVDADGQCKTVDNHSVVPTPRAGISRLLSSRTDNYKVIFGTGHHGSNIPNLTFSSDEDGEADKVVAIDLFGNLWLMDLWDWQDSPVHRIERLSVDPTFWPHWVCDHQGDKPGQRGWGVVVLPRESFVQTEDVEDALGLSSENVLVSQPSMHGKWLWTDKQNNKMPRRAILHPWLRGRSLETIIGNIRPESRYLLKAQYPWTHHTSRFGTLRELEAARGLFTSPASGRRASRDPPLKDGSSILRMYETDFELRSTEPGGWGVIHQYATRQIRPRDPYLPRSRYLMERLSNVVHVPELCLVLCGSMCGRVVLVTPTCPKSDRLGLKRGFRVETILPTVEEEERSLRPMCPLYGIAASPVPASGQQLQQKQTDRSAAPSSSSSTSSFVRYRLMIHYYDLTILSYELTRTPDNDLVIF